ncbi:hypothetical protein C8R45DRAFT_866090 [Mycena sanguinolenta]|nr:hypothetical protein C8R45DRAFT_866090 [Mycena sanguinolenta]
MASEHVSTASLSLSESHPLSEELSSLHALVTRFQNEAHSSAIKLQRHALDTSAYSERIVQLEAENRLLHTELGVLRDNPSPEKDKENDTVSELTLSLRRLNAKLSLTEAALAEHTRTLEETTALASQQTHAANEAYALAARLRGREEEGRQREAGLERALLQAREETRLTDRVVGEYAALVRKLEGRTSISLGSASATKLAFGHTHSRSVTSLEDSKAQLEHSKTDLADLVHTFADQISSLTARIASLESERDVAQAQLAASRTLVAELGDALATAKFEREQARVDDRSAAGMVERYMRFTQQTTTSLHASLTALRARHAATLETLHSMIATLGQRLEGKERETTTLRTALDAAALDVLRESVGRRREVGLRVRMVGREERVRRALGAAAGRAASFSRKANGHVAPDTEREDAAQKALARLEADVRAVLAILDGDVSVSPASPSTSADHGKAQDHDQGTEGRMRVLEEAVGMLVRELEGEVARRVGAEREGRAAPEEGSGEGERVAVALPATTSEVGAGAVPAPAERGEAERRARVEDEKAAGEVEEAAGAGEAVQEPHGDAEPMLHVDAPAFPPDAPVDEGVQAQETLAPGEGDAGEEEVQPDPKEPEVERERAETETETEAASNDNDSVALPSADSLTAEVAVVAHADSLGTPPSGDAATPATPPLPSLAPTPAVLASVPAPVAFPSSDIGSTPASFPSPAPAAVVTFPGAPQTPSNPHDSALSAHAETTPTPIHPVLAELAAASSRYDALQLAFRECHLALQELRTSLTNPTPTLAKGQSQTTPTSSLPNAQRLPPNVDVLRSAVERLYDYTEDARVELEIRVADGKVLARGWEAIGAFSAAVDADGRGAGDEDGGEGGEGVVEDVRRQITRDEEAQVGFRRKLDDVEHDIAVVKRAVYAPDLEDSPPPPPPISPAKAEGWAAWLGGSGSGSGSAGRTPPPSERDWDTDLAPTFGSVMTSPRLRHSASAARLAGKAQGNPFELLGLRVPMPTYIPQQQRGAPATPPRQRTISGVYLLGLGVGHSPRERRPSGFAVPLPPPRASGGEHEGDVE